MQFACIIKNNIMQANLVLSPIDPQLLIDRIAGKVTESVLAALKGKPDPTPEDTRRIVDAAGLAKYLKRPISAVYAMQHRGTLPAMRMPGSRRLYYDLDAIDALMAQKKEVVNND
ncbi:MAG: hypothetical protein J7502_16955 [Flavisolibacter sp.]|nr:hypothetical protein [Flavisolibacter sp.]